MAKKKRKLTARERSEKRRRSQELMTIFIHGKMKRIRRPPQIEGLDVDEFIRHNADHKQIRRGSVLNGLPKRVGGMDENLPGTHLDSWVLLQQVASKAIATGPERALRA